MNYVDLKDYLYVDYELSRDGETLMTGSTEIEKSIPAGEEGTIKSLCMFLKAASVI